MWILNWSLKKSVYSRGLLASTQTIKFKTHCSRTARIERVLLIRCHRSAVWNLPVFNLCLSLPRRLRLDPIPAASHTPAVTEIWSCRGTLASTYLTYISWVRKWTTRKQMKIRPLSLSHSFGKVPPTLTSSVTSALRTYIYIYDRSGQFVTRKD